MSVRRAETGGGLLRDVSGSDLAPGLQGAYCSVPGAGAGIRSDGNHASPWPGAGTSSGDTDGTDQRCHLQNFLWWKVEHAFIIHPASNARSEGRHGVYWDRKRNCATTVHGVPDLSAGSQLLTVVLGTEVKSYIPNHGGSPVKLGTFIPKGMLF